MADSACSSTAYLSGVKANYGTMGLSAKVLLNDCDGQNKKEHHTVSIAQWAQDAGKATGLVTTAKLTDASPGGIYARESPFVGLIGHFDVHSQLLKNFRNFE